MSHSTLTGKMMPELLAPAGGPTAFAAAIAAGADAIYVGTGDLDARAAAVGFDDIALAAAIEVAHAHGVRVYVTLNALMTENVFDRAQERARRIAHAGADALIVADIGLMYTLKADPELSHLEIHLSTQAGAQSPEAVSFAVRELGVSRVTCSRELSLEELEMLCNTGVPIEMFCHGAICINYSGACTYSALRRGRSASRGDCTQPCRMSYDLVDDNDMSRLRVKGEKLLCPHDYLALEHLEELCRMGIASLKIEGRMKNPDYVFNVVSVWRQALDAVATGEIFDVKRALFALGQSFNRGFTDAYLRGTSGAELMSFERSCNQGVFVGHVVARRRHEIDIELAAQVHAGDMFEVRSAPGPEAGPDVPERWPQVPCTVDAPAGTTITVKCKRKIQTGAPVNLTRSMSVLDASTQATEPVYQEFTHALAMRGGTLSPSERHVAPAQDQSHESEIAFVSLTNANINSSEICAAHEFRQAMRRMVVVSTPTEAQELLAKAKDTQANGAKDNTQQHNQAPKSIEVAVFAWRLQDDDEWRSLLNKLTVIGDEMARSCDAAELVSIVSTSAHFVCRNIGQVYIAQQIGVPFDIAAPLSCWNGASLRAAQSWGAVRVWIADELSDGEIIRLVEAAPQDLELGLLVHGAPQLMVTEHCMLTAMGPCSGDCVTCMRRHQQLFLQETNGSKLPLYVDVHGRTRIINNELFDRRELYRTLQSIHPMVAAEIQL